MYPGKHDNEDSLNLAKMESKLSMTIGVFRCRMDAVKFITICDVINCHQKPSTHTFAFICPSDEAISGKY